GCEPVSAHRQGACRPPPLRDFRRDGCSDRRIVVRKNRGAVSSRAGDGIASFERAYGRGPDRDPAGRAVPVLPGSTGRAGRIYSRTSEPRRTDQGPEETTDLTLSVYRRISIYT